MRPFMVSMVVVSLSSSRSIASDSSTLRDCASSEARRSRTCSALRMRIVRSRNSSDTSSAWMLRFRTSPRPSTRASASRNFPAGTRMTTVVSSWRERNPPSSCAMVTTDRWFSSTW